jgi:hypothetical protein
MMSNAIRKLPPWLWIFLDDDEKGYVDMTHHKKISRYVQMMEELVLSADVVVESGTADEDKILDGLVSQLVKDAIHQRRIKILQGVTKTTNGNLSTYSCNVYVLTEYELSGLIRRAIHDSHLP